MSTSAPITRSADLWFMIACNERHSESYRRNAWDHYEAERWYDSVYSGRLGVKHLESRLQERVYHMLCERTPLVR